MANLKGTKTHENLKAAFAGESQANRRYLYFAKVADVEGYPEIAGNFRETAEGETGHAHGHLDYLKSVGDPATDRQLIGQHTAVGRQRERTGFLATKTQAEHHAHRQSEEHHQHKQRQRRR
jgi:rubrerythrin